MSSDIVFEPSTSAVAQITQLSEMSMDEIKSLWRQLYRKEPPTHIRSFLEKRLAYRLQEVEFRRAHQNLAEKNDRRINAIINTGKKPLPNLPVTILTDASRLHGLGYAMGHFVDGRFKIVACGSKSNSATLCYDQA